MSDITEKIGKLLAQVEGTDNQEERDAFLSKAQTLATLYSIDLEMARQRQADKTKRETPTHRRIYLTDLGITARQGLHRYIFLFTAIADANDVECNIAHNSTYVIAFGFPSDIEVTERLFCSLVVQMVVECDAAIKRGEHKEACPTWVPARFDRNYNWVEGHYRTPDARAFKGSFFDAFRSRVRSRLLAAKREAEQQVVVDTETGQSTTGALVLRQKVDDVKDYYKANSTAKGTYRGGTRYNASHSSAGHNAGTRAGDNARLGAPSQVGGSRVAVSA